MLTVIAYDIADDRRRNEVSTMLADHGRRVNYSVFSVNWTATSSTCWHHLSRLIDVHEDRILFTDCVKTAVDAGQPLASRLKIKAAQAW
jgi:CRISPR-associated endonuclease Cas2